MNRFSIQSMIWIEYSKQIFMQRLWQTHKQKQLTEYFILYT